MTKNKSKINLNKQYKQQVDKNSEFYPPGGYYHYPYNGGVCIAFYYYYYYLLGYS